MNEWEVEKSITEVNLAACVWPLKSTTHCPSLQFQQKSHLISFAFCYLSPQAVNSVYFFNLSLYGTECELAATDGSQ